MSASDSSRTTPEVASEPGSAGEAPPAWLTHVLNEVQRRIESTLIGFRTDISSLRADISGLQADMSGLQADMSGLQADVSGLQADVSGLQAGMSRVVEATCSVLHPRMTEYFRRLQAVDFRNNLAPADFERKSIGEVAGFCSPLDFSWLYLEEGRVLVVRPAMLDICATVESMRVRGDKIAVVSGSPGTGKTAMSNLMVSGWLRDPKILEIVIHNASEPAAWHIRKRAVGPARADRLKRKRDGSSAAAAESLHASATSPNAAAASASFFAEENTFDVFRIPRSQVLSELGKIALRYSTEELNSVVYLFDAATATGQPERTSLFTVVTASPAENHFLDVKKRAGSTNPLYLPLWSLEDLQAAEELTFEFLRTTRINVEANFRQFNGVYRHCLRGDPTVWRRQRAEAVSRLNWLSMAILDPHSFSIAWPHRLVVIDSKKPYLSYRLKCVSSSIRQDLVAQLLRVNRARFFNLFQGTDVSLNKILGELWEAFVLSELSGGPTHQVMRASRGGERVPDEEVSDEGEGRDLVPLTTDSTEV